MRCHLKIGSFLLPWLISVNSLPLFSQQFPLQTVRGIILDKTSQSPLPGVNITILTTDPVMGASSDAGGQFIIRNVPTGRHRIQASFIGYLTITLDNQMVTSGKELVLKLEVEESAVEGKEVEIIGRLRKDQPVNPMAMISARSFTIEETSRYAGSYGDPARMAVNYAGVVSTRDNRNDIIVRGNSPFSLKYRIDGIEILNPNHFGATGTTGGPVTILNTNMLANSDFLTGAFPAEYGNATAGIFDIHLRSGNTGRREYWGQLGFNGLEFGTEGPFKTGGASSYLASYRYSFTGLAERAGIRLEESADYQDMGLRFSFPTKKAGIFRFTALGGISAIRLMDSEQERNEWIFDSHGEDLRTGSHLAAAGLSHLFFINEDARIQSYLSFTSSGIETTIDTFELGSPKPFRWAGERSRENKISASVHYKYKINSQNNLNAGVYYDLFMMNYLDSQFIKQEYIYHTDAKENLGLLRAYGGYQHRFGPAFAASLGLHLQHLSMNGSFSAEPRFGIRWDVTPLSAISGGFGLHSQMVPSMLYFTQSRLPDGTYIQTNRDLDFMRSLHAVAGYDYLIREHLRLKAEVFYQELYKIPVKESIPQYSVINEGLDYFILRYDSLVSRGSGTNFGLDLTMERFLHRNYYFLFTASLYRSDYTGYDNVKRNTAFDNRYVVNAVGGYELPFGKMKNQFLVLGLRATWTGGRPYLPFDTERTTATGQVEYDWQNAFGVRFEEYIRSSLRIGYRRNVTHANIMLLLDLQYRSNYTNIDLYRIDVKTGEIVQGYRMGFYPMATWRIQF